MVTRGHGLVPAGARGGPPQGAPAPPPPTHATHLRQCPLLLSARPQGPHPAACIKPVKSACSISCTIKSGSFLTVRALCGSHAVSTARQPLLTSMSAALAAATRHATKAKFPYWHSRRANPTICTINHTVNRDRERGARGGGQDVEGERAEELMELCRPREGDSQPPLFRLEGQQKKLAVVKTRGNEHHLEKVHRGMPPACLPPPPPPPTIPSPSQSCFPSVT